MSLLSVILLAGAMFVLAVTPGPGVFATVARALASGFTPAAELVVGIVIGDLVYLLLAIFGLGALAAVLGELFVVVKYAGAAYLLWLGWRLWHATPVDRDALRDAGNSRGGNLLTGLLITLANPKVILFYLGLLPTFIDLTALTATDVLVVVLVVSGVLGLTMLGYALIASRARGLIRDARVARAMNRTAGGAMILAGATLAARS